MVETLTVRPATTARLDDVAALFGTNKTVDGCFCMWFLLPVKECHAGWGAENQARFRALSAGADPPLGLLAYRDGEPVGWCAMGPRTRYARMLRAPTLRQRDPAEDERVWLVPCFYIRRDARRSGVSHALLESAVEAARRAGAVAVEGFPLAAGHRASAGDKYVGVEALFASAGFRPVAHPSTARVIMRRDL
jgi:GNAT superfamily N-acetyltransferase